MVGVAMGLLSLGGYTQNYEPFYWISFALLTALILGRNLRSDVFLHGVLIGIAWGLINGIIQVAFFKTYLANNPHLQSEFRQDTWIPARYFILVSSPLIGLLLGVIMGALAKLFSKG